MPFQKGHTLSKGKGRGSNEKALKKYKDSVKKLTIEELATDKVFKQITTLKGRDKKDRQGIKEIALPVYLKSKADKVEASVSIKAQEKIENKLRDIGNEENRHKGTS